MKKLLSLLLCLALLLALSPAALAADMESGSDPAEESGEGPEDSYEPEPEPEPPEGGDEPAYGVWPAEPVEEEPEPEAEPWEAEPETDPAQIAVWVSFLCTPSQTEVTVYTQGGERIGFAAGGSILLYPGYYLYDALCNGYEASLGIPFTVELPSGEGEEQTVSVVLNPLEPEDAPEGGDELPARGEAPEPLQIQPVTPGPEYRTPTVFFQADSRWGAGLYPFSGGQGANQIAASGCALLALTNAVYALNGRFVDPGFAADYAAEAGFHIASGTKWDFFRGFAKTHGAEYGIEFAGEADNFADLKEQMLRGCAAICSVPGHMMALVDYDAPLDRFLLLDSDPDALRATEAGFVWISQEELSAMPSAVYDWEGVYSRFVLLRAVGPLELGGVLDGLETDTLSGFGSFDVWIDGEQAADDVTEYSALLPQGTQYKVDDIRPQAGFVWYGVQSGCLEGEIRGEAASRILLRFGTRDAVSGRFAAGDETPRYLPQSAPPFVCASWAGGLLGPALRLPKT